MSLSKFVMSKFISSNLFRKYFSISLISGTLVLTGCGKTLWDRSNSSPDSQRLSPTVVGAAAGTAVGAGLGAIVGSASGDAGVGVAIGAAAGAATGGVIGYQIEKQDNRLVSQHEQLNQQGEQLRQNQGEIEELKHQFELEGFRNNRPSRGADRFSFDTYHGSPNARPLSGEVPITYGSQRTRMAVPFSPDADTSPKFAKRAASAVVEEESVPQANNNVDSSVSEINDLASQAPAKQPIATPGSDDEFAEDAPITDVTDPIALATSEATPEVLPPAVTENTSSPTPEPIKEPIAKAVTVSTGSACEQAQGEAERARTATSDADKLFYYRRALKLCPTEVSYHIEIAGVYSVLGKAEDAQFYYRQALDLDPGNEQVLEQLSLLE